MKKILALLLAMVMVASMLTACGSGNSSDTKKPAADSVAGDTQAPAGEDTAGDTQAADTTGDSQAQVWDGEVSHIVMTYLSLGGAVADLQKVQAAVNEITVPAIGVEVEFKEMAIFDTASQYSLLISSGEQIDLMMVAFTNLATYSDQGLILPLDELLAENAPYITNCVENEGFPLYDGTYYMGEVYGVSPLQYYYGKGPSYLVKQEYLDELGITYNEGEIWTLDQLTDLFAKIKEAHPDVYPCGAITSKATASVVDQYMNAAIDNLGATPSSGVLIGTDSTTVENMYASDMYYEYLTYLKEWYDAGYIYPDAATTDSTANELNRAGTLAGYPMHNQPVMKSDGEAALGVELAHIMLGDSYYTSQSSSGGAYWTVPITSADPAAAIRFLDYTFSNHEVHNLILWGIVGEHIEVLDEENLLIGFANGYDGATSPYYNTLGLYGDRRYEYIWDVANNKEVNNAYTEKAMANPTKGVGYAYDTTAMATKIANVDAVVQQYVPTLESGTASDLDALYQEFLAALETAGINDIIADNQAQFDAWLAEQ